LEIAATDGHRLGVATILPDEETGAVFPEFTMTVPGAALNLLDRFLNDADEVEIWVDDTNIRFVKGADSMLSRLLDGAYPSYNQLIPVQFSRQIVCDRRRLLGAVERVSVLSDKKSALVKLDVDMVSLTVKSDSADVGSAKESLVAQISGAPIEFAVNGKYLVEALKHCPGAEVKIAMNEANQPVIFEPTTGIRQIALVMPVQIVR
jgi:DNA polymerase-3 subunit beta